MTDKICRKYILFAAKTIKTRRSSKNMSSLKKIVTNWYFKKL